MPSNDRITRARGVLIGCEIGAVAGIAWSLWGASGLAARSVAWTVVVAGLGVVIGALMLIFMAMGLHRVPAMAPAGQEEAAASMFSSPRYRITVMVEVTVIVAGVLVLGAINQARYIPPFIAIIVGVHFLGFLASWRGFALLSGALVVASVAGVIVGFAGGQPGDIAATVGIIAAVSLFCSAARAFTPSARAIR